MALIEAGVCLHLITQGQDRPHLYVVLNDPYGDPPHVCLVNFSTKVRTDATVVLKPGEPGMHVFVKEQTHVVYAWAKILSATKLENIVKKDLSKKHHKNCSATLLERLRQGLFRSPFTKESVLDFCKKAFGPNWRPINPATSKRA